MKTRAFYYVTALALAVSAFFAAACSDNVDDSNLYAFEGETITSYLQNNDGFDMYSFMLTKVMLSRKSQSTVSQLLSARGNYTCFAPTDEAVQVFLDSVYRTKGYDYTQTDDSVAETIVRNSIIDCGNVEAYRVADLVEGTVPKTNMYDRYITVSYDTVNGRAVTRLNNDADIVVSDVEASNGYIHVVNRVLSLSNAYLPEIIRSAPNLRIFNMLLELTGWDEAMLEYIDQKYEDEEHEAGKDETGRDAEVPEHRYFGYTAFVETDSVFNQKWGIDYPVIVDGHIANEQEILSQIENKCRLIYSDAASGDYKNEDNAVNRFVSYHILPMRIAYDKLVIHYGELGYAYRTPTQLSINCHEYYETISKKHRRLIKLTEGKTTEGIRLNRYSVYDPDTYDETIVPMKGIHVSSNNGKYDFNALNGFYYPIDDVLVYDSDVRDKVLNERLRFDVSSLLPELMTNGYRKTTTYAVNFPSGYFENLTYNKEANCAYLGGYGCGWPDFQGDEHNFTGQYDLTLKLPPVPFEGTWEIRWSVPIFSNRGMAQLYLGTNPENLAAIGLPLDLRLEATNPTIGWEEDTDDEQLNDENDKVLRNHGYMKPPRHDGATTGGVVSKSLREETQYQRMRKIIYTGNMKPTDVYYVRCKSVLSNNATQFVMDWIELCPRNVYNGSIPEDKW